MSNKDLQLLLLTLGENETPVRGRKRLQKTVCLLRYRYKIPFSYEFKPYYYGPYSEQLADSIELMKASGLVEEKADLLTSGFKQYRYSLTEAGRSLYEQVIKRTEVGKEFDNTIKKAEREIGKMTTEELVITSKGFLLKHAVTNHS